LTVWEDLEVAAQTLWIVATDTVYEIFAARDLRRVTTQIKIFELQISTTAWIAYFVMSCLGYAAGEEMSKDKCGGSIPSVAPPCQHTPR
jgi:hypothetical protein